MHLDTTTPAGNLALDGLRGGLGVVGGLGGAPFLTARVLVDDLTARAPLEAAGVAVGVARDR